MPYKTTYLVIYYVSVEYIFDLSNIFSFIFIIQKKHCWNELMAFLCSYVYGKKCFEIRAIWNPRLFTERIKLVRRECHCILIYYPYIIDIDRGYYASSTINYAIHLVCYYIQHLQSNNNYVGVCQETQFETNCLCGNS